MKIVIPVVSKSSEKFDFANFNSEEGFNSFTDSEGNYTEYEEQDEDGYIARICPPNSFFMVIKRFYKNGNIKEKGLTINYGDFAKGKWFYFNETGIFEREEDFDVPFGFRFEDLINYLEKEQIPLSLGYSKQDFHTSFYNYIDSTGPKWRVEWAQKTGGIQKRVEEIIIDGNNGKVLEKNHSTFTDY